MRSLIILVFIISCAKQVTEGPGKSQCLANLLEDAEKIKITSSSVKGKSCSLIERVSVGRCFKTKSSSPNYHTNVLRNKTHRLRGNVLLVEKPLRADSQGKIHGLAYRCELKSSPK